MERPERPTREYLEAVGWLLLVLNLAVAYAVLIGRAASGWQGALMLFAWGSLLVSGGIVGALCVNLLFLGARGLLARIRRGP